MQSCLHPDLVQPSTAKYFHGLLCTALSSSSNLVKSALDATTARMSELMIAITELQLSSLVGVPMQSLPTQAMHSFLLLALTPSLQILQIDCSPAAVRYCPAFCAGASLTLPRHQNPTTATATTL